jgi:uncharacterized protein YggE
MDKTQKTIVFWSGLVLAVLLAAFLITSIDQKMDAVSTANTVTFTGEGKVLAKPDVAMVDFAIVTDAKDSKTAQDKNSAKSKTVVEFLKKQGIEEKDIKTSGYNIYPQYSYPRYDKPEIQGYTVNQTIQVKIRNLENVSKVLDGVVAAGVNQVNNLQFTIDEPEKLKAEARSKAIIAAKAKADELKGQIGLKLGRIVNFSENIGGYAVPMMYAKSMEGGVGGGGPTVPSGENEITVNVTITYQIK